MTDPIDPNVERGADNLATRCLCVQPGERVKLLTWRAEEVCAAVARALERAGAVVEREPLEPHARKPDAAAVAAQLAASFAGATASVYIGATGAPRSASLGALRAASRKGNRHLHVPRAEPRLLAQSARAEPDLLTVINERVAALLRPPSRIQVTSDAGTALDVTLSLRHPLLAANGRPAPDAVDNLPSGYVYTHPAQVSGTFVADRGIVSTVVRAAPAALRRSPVHLTLAGGRVTGMECADAEIRASLEAFFASHPDAGRVGLVKWPTNYLARSEIGLEAQDALLPGMTLSMGYTAAELTQAPFDAPVQLRFLGRRLNVEVGGKRLVSAGRFEDALVEGIDPFR